REHATAEPDHPALLVADREHQTSTKSVVVVVRAFLAQDKTCLFGQLGLISFALGPVDGVLPRIGRAAEPEELHRLRGHSTLREIITGDLPTGLVGEGVLPALSDLLMDLQQLILNVPGLLLARTLLILQRYLGPFGQSPHGFRKINILVFL